MRMTPDALKVTIELTKPFPFRDEDVEKSLVDQGFSRPKEDERIVMRLAKDGSQSPATRWIQGGVNAFYEPTRGRLSVEGRDIKEMSESFAKLLQSARLLMDGAKDVQVRWTELLANFRAYGQPPPLEVFRGIAHSKAEEVISGTFGEEMHSFSLTLCSADDENLDAPLNKVENWVHLTIRPLVPNPSVYVVELVYRKRDPNVVRERVETLIDSLEKTLSSLGVKEM